MKSLKNLNLKRGHLDMSMSLLTGLLAGIDHCTYNDCKHTDHKHVLFLELIYKQIQYTHRCKQHQIAHQLIPVSQSYKAIHHFRYKFSQYVRMIAIQRVFGQQTCSQPCTKMHVTLVHLQKVVAQFLSSFVYSLLLLQCRNILSSRCHQSLPCQCLVYLMLSMYFLIVFFLLSLHVFIHIYIGSTILELFGSLTSGILCAFSLPLALLTCY